MTTGVRDWLQREPIKALEAAMALVEGTWLAGLLWLPGGLAEPIVPGLSCNPELLTLLGWLTADWTVVVVG